MPLPPGFTEIQQATAPVQTPSGGPPAGFQEQGPDWGGVVKQALNEARAGDGSKIKALMTDPVTQAKALPFLLGTALAGPLALPLGATLGTVGGRQLSNAALTSYNKKEEIPSTSSQIVEGATSLASDLAPIPAMNRKIFGKQIGVAEQTAGVPPAQEIPSLPKPMAGQPVSGGLDETIKAVSRAKEQGAGSPTFWKQIKDQIDSFYGLGKDGKLTDLDKGKLKWLSNQVQTGLNASVPGRAAPAASLALSQAVPNAIGNVTRAIPWWAKAVATGVGGDALLRTISNIPRR